MNSVGIDVSKGKSMIAVMRPFGEVVVSPFEIHHTDGELCELAKLLRSLSGGTRVVMEATGNYYLPVAWLLNDSGFYVSVVNAMLVHDYGNNSLRRAKTDKKDAIKLANYGLDHWLTLPRYVPEEDTRLMLKNCYRQYQQYSKVQTMLKNNLIPLLDTAFPDVNRLFLSPPRADGSEKWVDFAGIDAPPYQSGQMDVYSRSISKRGSSSLRRTLFLVMGIYLQNAPADEPVYQFMDKKRSEGKPYKAYMMASANKFLRIYYATVKAYLDALEEA